MIYVNQLIVLIKEVVVASSNKHFEKVYNKVLKILDEKAVEFFVKKKYGVTIDYTKIKIFNAICKYMDIIKRSDYDYYYISSLTEISNYLNRI